MMPRFTTSVAVLGLLAQAWAQDVSSTSSASAVSGSVTSVLLFNAEPQSLVASRVGEHNGVQTLAVQCAAGVNSTACDYPSPATFTAGPSTVHASLAYPEISLTVDYGCNITSTTAVTCIATYTGRATDLANNTADAATATGITTTTITTTLAQTDITYYPITITAGADVTAASSLGSSVSSKSSAASFSASKTSGSTSSPSGTSSPSSSSSAHSGAGQILAPGIFAAGLLGLAALL